MATNTTNYGLSKPGANESYDISVFNSNADKIDAALAKVDGAKITDTKATPADGDSLPLVDSADGSKTKRVLWSRVKAVLKAYFDPIYAAAAHSHAWSTITGKPSSFAPAAHASTHGSSGTDPVTPAAIGAAASAHKHGAGDINSGTLDAARLPTVPVTRGGTGAATAAAARTNLGAAPAYSYGTEDLTAGTSALETGKLHFVYE